MKKGDLYILLKDVNKSNNKVTLGVYFVILSPMIFTVLCAYRKYSMNIINALGIGWILLCVVLSLPLLIKGMVGIVKYVKVTGEEIYVSKITGDYIYDWKKSTSKTLVNLFTVGIILCVSSIVPIITVSMLRLSNYVYVAYSYIFIFLVAGAGLSIIIGAAIKTYLMCHLKIVISKEIVDKHGSVHEIEKRKITRKNYIIKTVIVLAAIICLVIIMSQGTWYIQPYIATIPSVEHRNLQVSYNKNSGVYQKENQLISSLIFTHMPLQEYESAYNLYKDGSTEVKYYYGEIGEKDEEICCSKYKSKLFDTAVKLGSTKGIFVGHDHYNNISMEYKNIRLTYGMSIDYLAMLGISEKTKQRGGTLITLHSDSTIDIKQVPFSK